MTKTGRRCTVPRNILIYSAVFLRNDSIKLPSSYHSSVCIPIHYGILCVLSTYLKALWTQLVVVKDQGECSHLMYLNIIYIK